MRYADYYGDERTNHYCKPFLHRRAKFVYEYDKGKSNMSELPRQHQKEKHGNEEDVYTKLFYAIHDNPHAETVWGDIVARARAEEALSGGSESFYTHVPLDELIAVGERLRGTRLKEEQYKILSERCSTGERWYDIVLGHVNDKAFAPIADALRHHVEERGQQWENGLDIGSGTGNTLRAIAPYFKSVKGVDRIEAVLQKEQREDTLPKNVQIVAGEATELPFDNDIFDVAVSNGLTHYLSREDMQRYVDELARVIKPGGFYCEPFVVKETNSLLPGAEKEYLTSAKALLVYLIDNCISRGDQTQSSWSLKEMVAAFQSHGFTHTASSPNENGAWFIQFRKGSALS